MPEDWIFWCCASESNENIIFSQRQQKGISVKNKDILQFEKYNSEKLHLERADVRIIIIIDKQFLMNFNNNICRHIN